MKTSRVMVGVVPFLLILIFPIWVNAKGTMDYSKCKVSGNTGMYSVSDLFTSSDRPEKKWIWCDPAKYRDMKFYDKDGKACERWLDNNGIKGEHVFVTTDDWRRLSSIFNFSSIPFGVLIDKKGEVIATHYDIIQNTKLLDDALTAE